MSGWSTVCGRPVLTVSTTLQPNDPAAVTCVPNPLLARLCVEKLENLAGALGGHPRNLAKVGDRGPLDLLQGAEMVQESAFARRSDAGNLLQARFADVLLAQLAVRADHETMRLVAQPLDEIQHGIARLELDRLALGQEQRLAAGIAVRPLCHPEQRDFGHAEPVQDFLGGVELAAPAIDDHEVGPLREGVIVL